MARGYKTGGRQKGTPKKTVSEIREYLRDIIEGELEALPQALKKMEPEKRIDTIIKLFPYAIPRINPVDIPQEDMKKENDYSDFMHRLLESKDKNREKTSNPDFEKNDSDTNYYGAISTGKT